MLDLVLPLECGGCGAPSTRWCDACASALRCQRRRTASSSRRASTPACRSSPSAATPARAGRPSSRSRSTAAATSSTRWPAPLALGIHRLTSWGILGDAAHGGPGSDPRAAARRRGGDPVTRIAAARHRGQPAPSPSSRRCAPTALVRDSVGLTSTARRAQHRRPGAAHRARCRVGEVLLVDDVVTTGATAREAVRVLHTAGRGSAGCVLDPGARESTADGVGNGPCNKGSKELTTGAAKRWHHRVNTRLPSGPTHREHITGRSSTSARHFAER